jgi:hypothetical protein
VTIVGLFALVFAAKPRKTRKVVDTNRLQHEALRSYLSASADNCVVRASHAH